MNNTNDSNNVNDTNEAATVAAAPTKKPRGRPKGTLVGPRPVLWTVAGIAKGEVIQEAFQAADGSTNEERENFSADQAKAAFEAKYGVPAAELKADGPNYRKMGKYQPQGGTSKQKETFSMTGKENLNSIMRNAIFRGWKGIAIGINDRNDGYLFTPIQEVNSTGDKKNAPKRAGVYTQFLTFLDEEAEQSDSEQIETE